MPAEFESKLKESVKKMMEDTWEACSKIEHDRIISNFPKFVRGEAVNWPNGPWG